MSSLSEYHKLQGLVEDMFGFLNLVALQKREDSYKSIENSNEIISELERIRKKHPEFDLEPHRGMGGRN